MRTHTLATAALVGAALCPTAAPADELAIKQSKVKGLLVRPLATGENAGMASQMNATATPAEDAGRLLRVRFNQDVGGMMEGALKEVLKFLQVRHDDWPRGQVVEIAFEERYSPKDGPSAAVACALLLDSLLTGDAIDPAFAVTGDMNADGSVKPVGGVPAKIRGAAGKGCTVVGVPIENAPALTDLVVLDGASPLAAIQVFTLETFDQAKALAAAEKGEELAAAIADFALVQRAVEGRGAGILRNPKVVAKLREIVARAPNHLSAKLLLDAAVGGLPRQLSLVGSLEAIERSAATVLEAARGQKDGIGALDKDELAAAIIELRRTRAKLDERTRDYADSIEEFGRRVSDYQNSPPRGVPLTRKAIAEIQASAQRIETEVRKIKNDTEMMEELMAR